MTDISRLGLGCMGMNRSNKVCAIETVHAAFDRGITHFNTGEFYGQGESELVLGEAFQGLPRDRFFVSVKFGMLPKADGGLYGIDMNPKNIRAHLVYSLKRLNLDYVDLYEPARLDEAIPVEDVVGEIANLIKEGYVRHAGLTMVDSDTLRRASKTTDIHTVEMEYSLLNRGIEKDLIQTAKDTGTKVLAFGALSHGLISEKILDSNGESGGTSRFMPPNIDEIKKQIRDLKTIAEEKETTLSKLALAWTLSKYDEITSLIGTTSVEHLQDSIDALSLELTKDDIQKIEEIFPQVTAGSGTRTMRFVNGELLWG